MYSFDGPCYNCGNCCCCCDCDIDSDDSHERYDDCDCERCRQDSRYYRLHGYSYTPRLIFRGDGPVWLGMELEVTAGCDLFAGAAGLLNGSYGEDSLTEDSSVDGFEAVTHPMTYQWAMGNFPWQALPELRQRGARINASTNGLHVHVSRGGFGGGAHQYRWMKFLYQNKRDVIRIARRNAEYYGPFSPTAESGQLAHALKFGKNPCARSDEELRARGPRHPGRFSARMHPRDGVRYIWDAQQYDLYGRRGDWWHDYNRRLVRADTMDGRELLAYSQDPPGQRVLRDTTLDDRYNAINTTNADTLEVRVFASSLRPQEVQAALGLVDASVEYTRRMRSPKAIGPGYREAKKRTGKQWQWPEFIGWAGKQGKYAPLIAENERQR
jgi:hypothetical protein